MKGWPWVVPVRSAAEQACKEESSHDACVTKHTTDAAHSSACVSKIDILHVYKKVQCIAKACSIFCKQHKCRSHAMAHMEEPIL